MRETVYIAGPYAAASDLLIEENVARAARLGRFAVAQGFAPIVPHLLGRGGIYGNAFEHDDGTSRRNALECSVALAAGCDRFWLILRDDGTASDGCIREEQAWLATFGPADEAWGDYRRMTWVKWLEAGV